MYSFSPLKTNIVRKALNHPLEISLHTRTIHHVFRFMLNRYLLSPGGNEFNLDWI